MDSRNNVSQPQYTNSQSQNMNGIQNENSQNYFKQTNPSQKKKGNKLPIIGAVTGVLVLSVFVITGITVFAGNGEQTYLSMLLDATGNHETALLADLAVNPQKRQNISFLSTDGNQNYCNREWKRENFNRDPLWAHSGAFNVDIRPVNPQLRDSTYLNSDFEYNLNIRDERALARVTLSGGADVRLAKSEIENYQQENQDGEGEYDSENYIPSSENINTENIPDNINILFQGSAIATKDAGYVTLDRGEVEIDSFSSQNKLTKWYKEETFLTNEQKSAVSDVLDLGEEYLKTNPVDVLSEETGKKVLDIVCEGIEEVELENIQDVKLSVGDQDRSFRARVARVETQQLDINDPGFVDESQEKQLEIALAALEDEKFQEFVKNQYPQYVKFISAGNKIFEDDQVETLSEEEYRKNVEEFFDTQADSIKKIQETEDDSENGNVEPIPFEITNEPVMVYFNPSNMRLIAAQSSTTIKFTDELEEEYKFLEDYIKDGIVTTSTYYDFKYNEDVATIEIPSEDDVVDFKEFQNDLEETGLTNSLDELNPDSLEEDNTNDSTRDEERETLRRRSSFNDESSSNIIN